MIGFVFQDPFFGELTGTDFMQNAFHLGLCFVGDDPRSACVIAEFGSYTLREFMEYPSNWSPEQLQELDETIMLLGNRTKGELRTKAKTRLTDLVGSYPSEDGAAEMKQSLRQLRKSFKQPIADD